VFPDTIPHFGIGPFFGLAINLGMAMLCLVILCFYRRYRPLTWLFFFYLCSLFWRMVFLCAAGITDIYDFQMAVGDFILR
jgi:hypothetical protein